MTPDIVVDIGNTRVKWGLCGPAGVTVDRIDRQADDLDAALVEFRLDARHVTELGGADRGEILGMRKQHGP